MSERGIIFSGEMVRAILDGRKTMTRRIVKPQPDKSIMRPVPGQYFQKPCPYGQAGDRLYCKETWQVDAPRDGTWCDTMFYGDRCSPLDWIPERYRKPEHCLYRATWDGVDNLWWRSSRFMPKWASRIWLELTGVRPERLQDITREDAQAEGITEYLCEMGLPGTEEADDLWRNRTSIENFAALWDSINGERSPWERNDWVWALSFRRIDKEQS